jgi:hypothetical protein
VTTKKERAEKIERLAFEMAQSGEYDDYSAIELALRARGYEEARTQLDSPGTRHSLNEICNSNKGKRSADRT